MRRKFRSGDESLRAGAEASLLLAYLGYLGGGCFSLRVQDLRFGLEPVRTVVAVLAATRFVELVGV